MIIIACTHSLPIRPQLLLNYRAEKIFKSPVGSKVQGGKDKETLLETYKAIDRPVTNYAALLRLLVCSGTQRKKFKTCQNTALHTVTGYLLFHRNLSCSHLLRAEPRPRGIKRLLRVYVEDIGEFIRSDYRLPPKPQPIARFVFPRPVVRLS